MMATAKPAANAAKSRRDEAAFSEADQLRFDLLLDFLPFELSIDRNVNQEAAQMTVFKSFFQEGKAALLFNSLRLSSVG